ncbi:MAG: 2,3-bisphosphoglycerate-dependent phosphoglycerate mutase [Bacteroidia bacterium]|nr:2,3-bisphosphoglycerate-dependent phosphoglycerate mutase [Bacteroidia bacterium]
MKNYLVIFRHGQSIWNLENKFTGWVDVDLSEKGIEEAKQAGKKLSGLEFHVAFSSALIRAQRTLTLALQEIKHIYIPTFYSEALNERMYGDLQGLNKEETAKKFGEEQVKIWRRSYDVAPPNGESLKDTAARVIPYYENKIVPFLNNGQNVIISAHGNSLRALIMYLEKMTPEQILNFEIGTAQPRMYLFENKKILEIKNL